ncbi:hypothetical protein TGAMA5MH_02437 [Trichoderma gamsii]|nr:hypothetical protein TGAMA5MH_02437 [Trichoderma gamsii]
MFNPRKRRRNSDSLVKDTPVAREKFFAQATMLGSSSAAYVFGSCVGARRPFDFMVPDEEARNNINADTLDNELKGDEARPDEANPDEDIDGEPFEDDSTDEE